MTNNGHNTQKRYFKQLEKEREKKTPFKHIHFENKGAEEEASRFVDEISEFEDILETAPDISIRDFIGSPTVRLLADVIPSEIELELDRILSILAEHRIFIDFLYLDDDFEAYRFIVEELLDELIKDVPLCMNCRYIYEEFHPNDIEDAKMWAEEFIAAVFSNNRKRMNICVSNEHIEVCSIDATPAGEIQGLFDQLHANNSSYKLIKVNPIVSNVQGDHAVVEMTLCWKLASCDLVDASPSIGRATIYLKKSDFGGWGVTHFNLSEIG